MKGKNFRKTILLIAVLLVCAMSILSAEPSIYGYSPPDLSQNLEFSTPSIAFAAAVVAIPAFDFKNLKSVTEAEFSALQAKFGKLYIVDISIDKNETYQFIVRRPTRQHLEIIAGYGSDTTKINDFTIKNLVVAGNEKNALDDGLVYSAFNSEIAKIIGESSSFLSKA
jgi:hypothetical protein